MFFFLGQDRSYLNEVFKPEGVLRIVCIGDSMTFGQGCLPTETLPFQLESILNAALWNHQVEVINGGVCGYSIHDAWNRYRNKFSDVGADLIILTVCDNDAELYNHREATEERVQKQSYLEFSEACYDPEGEHFPYFRLLLQDIARNQRNAGPPVVLAFYDIHGGSHRERLMPCIRDACNDAGIVFADLSQDFLDTAAATHNKLLKVSTVDAHPSPLAHNIAARRLARIILESRLVPQPQSDLIPEPELVKQCFARADELIKFGANAGKAFFFLKRSLASKLDSRARLRLADNALLDEAAYREAWTSLAQSWRRFVSLSIWEAYFKRFRTDITQFNFGLSLFDMALARLAKTLFVLNKRLADPTLPLVQEFQVLPTRKAAATEAYNLGERVSQWRQKHLQVQAFAASTWEATDRVKNLLPASDSVLTAQVETLKHQVTPLWRQVDLALKAAEHHLQEYNSLAESVARADDAEMAETLARAHRLLEESLGHLDFCLTAARYDNLLLLARRSERQIETSLTSLQVEVTAPKRPQLLTNEEPLSIEVQVKSVAPFERVTSDIHTLIQDGIPRLYRFQFPFFVEAEIRLGFKGGQEVELRSVQLCNAVDRPITLSLANFVLEREGQVYYAESVFVPL